MGLAKSDVLLREKFFLYEISMREPIPDSAQYFRRIKTSEMVSHDPLAIGSTCRSKDQGAKATS